jgi:hypothetical protein
MEGLSKRGKHNQSTEPSRLTSSAVPIRQERIVGNRRRAHVEFLCRQILGIDNWQPLNQGSSAQQVRGWEEQPEYQSSQPRANWPC